MEVKKYAVSDWSLDGQCELIATAFISKGSEALRELPIVKVGRGQYTHVTPA